MKKKITFIIFAILLLTACGCKKKPEPLHIPKDFVISNLYTPSDYELDDLKKAVGDIDYIALKIGKNYGFNGKMCFEYDYDDERFTAIDLSGYAYAPASGLAEAIGFDYNEETTTFSHDNITFSIDSENDKMTYNGTSKDFFRAVEIDGKSFVNAENFAKLLGLEYEFDADSNIAFMKNSGSKSTVRDAAERYDFYEKTVYTDEKVECDTTGKGKFKKAKEEDRLVGISYATWFYEGRRWGGWSTWDMPLIGSYSSFDRDVIKKHGEWLRDAGVDFVFVDWSNNVKYDPAVGMKKWTGLDFETVEKATETLFDVWSDLEGAPKICIFTGPGHEQTQYSNVIENGIMAKKTQQIYDTFLANEKYAKQYFNYEGKPLLMCYAATPAFFDTKTSPYNDERFTIRWVTGYVGQQSTLYDEKTRASYMMWSWEERGVQTFAVNGKYAECMTVCASTRAQGEEGSDGYIAAAGRDNGATFRTQWARAQAIGVKIALVVSWNEWTTAEQYSAEISKDIEPSEIYGTLYLDILRNQIRLFKGEF